MLGGIQDHFLNGVSLQFTVRLFCLMAGSRVLRLFKFVISQDPCVVLQCAAVTIKTSSMMNLRNVLELPSF